MVYSPTGVYSIEVPHTATENSGPIRRYPGIDPPQLAYEGSFTVYELFRTSVAKHGHRPFLGQRPIDSEGNAGPYVFQSYEEVARRVDNFGSGLAHEDLLPPNADGLHLLGIYLKNCPEWNITEFAVYSMHGATVPLYDTLGPDTVSYVINQTELTTVVVGPKELENLVAAAPKCPSLKAAIVVTNALNDHQRHLGRKGGLRLYSFADMERLGFRYPHPQHPPEPEDVATFSYTSGTTGGPKGALISHRNMICVFASGKVLEVEQSNIDVHFSYLPLPHVFERIVQVGVVGSGAAIGYWQGSAERLIDDLKALKPTGMPAVPRVLNRMYDKVMQGVKQASPLRQAIFRKAYAAKLSALHERQELKHSLWDKLVFNKIKRELGFDRMRIMCTGSAPLASHVLDFMRVVTGSYIFEGYGQTETTAMTSITFPGDWTTGHVGGIAPVCELKLEDVPEMGYLHTDRTHGAITEQGSVSLPCVGRGEICVRGPHVFQGYYKMPDKTAEAIDSDGWLHSGDIGMFDPLGRLIIIDRKKNIFKLAQGEYVAAEKIENVHMQCELIMQSFVYGDSLKSELVAVVVPDLEELPKWAADNNMGSQSVQELCRSELLREHLLKEIELASKRAGLHGFETVKAIYIESEPFSLANNLLTPTMKLKRQEARERYRSIIDELYAQVERIPRRSKL